MRMTRVRGSLCLEILEIMFLSVWTISRLWYIPRNRHIFSLQKVICPVMGNCRQERIER